MKRIVFVVILSIVLAGTSIPVLAAEHGGGGHGGVMEEVTPPPVVVMEVVVMIVGIMEAEDTVEGTMLIQSNVPPPVYYAPDPYPAPGINFVIPLHIR